jgi:hypothetical protein
MERRPKTVSEMINELTVIAQSCGDDLPVCIEHDEFRHAITIMSDCEFVCVHNEIFLDLSR